MKGYIHFENELPILITTKGEKVEILNTTGLVYIKGVEVTSTLDASFVMRDDLIDDILGKKFKTKEAIAETPAKKTIPRDNI